MTTTEQAEEVVDALIGDCHAGCGGRHVKGDHTLAFYMEALGASAPGAEDQYAWTCDRCGSTLFK